MVTKALIHTRRFCRRSLARELILGSDALTPVRPGQFLETEQRLGILPTWTFWNRRDVWRSARWFALPAAAMAVEAGMGCPAWLDLPMMFRLVAEQAVGAATLVLALGLLERLI